MAHLEKLSDNQIRLKLAELGHPVGPITNTTRKILIKRLDKLLKEKPTRRNVSSFSSAEDSEAEEHGGVGRSKRISMPPPESYKSRIKVSSVNNSLNISTPSAFLTPSSARAPSRRWENSRNRTRSSYDFDSGSDSDFSISSAPSSSRLLTNYRTSLSPSPRASISSNTGNSFRKESKPFLSNITRRLAKWNNDLNPQDIKESVDVDDAPTSINPTSFVQRTPVVRPYYANSPTVNTGWTAQIIKKGPMLLLSLFLLLFLWIAVTYCIKVYQNRPLLTGKSNNVYPVCTEIDTGRCIQSEDLPLAAALYKHVHKVLLSRAVQSLCGPANEDGSYVLAYMTEREIIQYIMKERLADVKRIDIGVRNLGLLLMANPHWGINVLRGDVELPSSASCHLEEAHIAVPADVDAGVPLVFQTPCVELSWGCRLRLLFTGFVYYLAALMTCLGVIYVVFTTARFYVRTMKEEEDQVMRLVEKILCEVTEGCARSQIEFVAIRHVHDTLIPPAHRPRMKPVWEKAVQFIEKNESRVRREIETVWGEATEVWRPLVATIPTTPSSLSSPDNHLYPDLANVVQREGQRVWQGEAFETSAGSINALPVSPTPCLKIRHMFQQNKNYGADWDVAVRDAIIEKCEGVNIVHASVDTGSKEGCVYLKCSSSADAGQAFRRLHGSWFDGALVTVKYLRLERYHERFPDSVNSTVPLKPSNNLRLSMGSKA